MALWPPGWWPLTSLSPIVGGEVEESDGKLCARCEREPWMGRLLNVGNRQLVCVDCFAFVTGMDSRDPIEDPTARSGDPRYVARSESVTVSSYEEFEEQFGPARDNIKGARARIERAFGEPLPKTAPWWARLMHWAGHRFVQMR